MTLLTSLAAMPGLETLAWTLVHFLWQGALLALAAAAVMRWAAASASARYTAGVVTLAAMLAAPVATFVALDNTGAPATAAAIDASAISAASDPAAFDGLAVGVGPQSDPSAASLLPALVVLWMAGVLVLSIRLLGGWLLARRVAARAAEPASRHLEELAARVAERLNLQRIVRLAESTTVAVPIVVGWLKPIVVVPAATLSHLAPAQVEALLAHELAHVRRHDYLVNLLQSAVETLLFYHPAVWWVSRRVRVEREHCCDDLAVSVCDRLVYVRALSDLAAMSSHARLALAATDGSLLGRVRRLLAEAPDHRQGAGWLTVGLVAILTAAIAPAVALGSAGAQQPAAPPAAIASSSARTVQPTQPKTNGQRETGAPAAATAATVQQARADAELSVQDARQKTNSPERSRALDAAELDVLRQQLEALKAELSAVAQRRLEARAQQVEQEQQLRIQGAAERVAALEKELAAATRRQEVGLANGEAVDSVQAMVAEARRELQRAETERRFSRVAAELEARQAELQRAHDRLQRQYAAALPAIEKASEAVSMASSSAREAAPNGLSSTTPVTDPAALIQRGDTLEIVIEGEDQLPRTYRVSADGTIRLPLVGSIGVVDITAGQARDSIRKMLTERQLAAGRAVSVMIRRAN